MFSKSLSRLLEIHLLLTCKVSFFLVIQQSFPRRLILFPKNACRFLGIIQKYVVFVIVVGRYCFAFKDYCSFTICMSQFIWSQKLKRWIWRFIAWVIVSWISSLQGNLELFLYSRSICNILVVIVCLVFLHPHVCNSVVLLSLSWQYHNSWTKMIVFQCIYVLVKDGWYRCIFLLDLQL